MMRYKSLLVGWVVAVSLPGLLCCEIGEFVSKNGICCPKCRRGSFVMKECTEDTGTRCQGCTPGTFMDEPSGTETCFICTVCNPDFGLFMKQKCTTTTNTVCEPLSGYYCKSDEKKYSCGHAVKHSQCSTGQEVAEPGTRVTDTVCEDCLYGYFSADGKSCKPWRTCPENEVMVKEGSLHADVVCSRSSKRNHFALTADLLVFSGLIVAFMIRSCVTP